MRVLEEQCLYGVSEKTVSVVIGEDCVLWGIGRDSVCVGGDSV